MSRPAQVATWLTIAAILLVGGTIALVLSPSLRASLGFRASAGYSIGEVVDLPPSWLSTSGFTAVLFLRHSCPSCQAASPHLQHLIRQARTGSVSVIAVIGHSAASQDREFARDLGVPDQQVREADVRRLRVRTVPTLLLVAPGGQIVQLVEGLVTATSVNTLLLAGGARTD
jgi:hypothetical protein